MERLDPDESTHGTLTWRADHDKGGRTRTTPVPESVREALKTQRRRDPGVGEAPIFPAPNSDAHLRVDVALRWLRKVERKARPDGEHVKGFGWHALRRRWANKMKGRPARRRRPSRRLERPARHGDRLPARHGRGHGAGTGGRRPGPSRDRRQLTGPLTFLQTAYGFQSRSSVMASTKYRNVLGHRRTAFTVPVRPHPHESDSAPPVRYKNS